MNRQKAFTTVELLIATAVFSVVLLVAIFGFLQIGQIFYKGITVTRTQDVTEDIINNLSADVKFASDVFSATNQSGTLSGKPYRFICAGTHRYTIMPGNMVETAAWNYDGANPSFGIIKDDLAVSGSCANPYPSGPGSDSFSNPTELLGERMRASVINVAAVNANSLSGLSDLYNLNVRIVYGENAILQYAPPSDTDPANDACNSSLKNSQFCHVANMTTTVRRGF